MSDFKAKNAPNSISAWVPSRTPLGELTALHQTPQLYFRGPTSKEREGVEGYEGKGRGDPYDILVLIAQKQRYYINFTYDFRESLGDLAQSEDCLSAEDERLGFVLNDVLERQQQILGAEVAHGLDDKDLVLLGLRLLQQAHQLLPQPMDPTKSASKLFFLIFKIKFSGA